MICISENIIIALHTTNNKDKQTNTKYISNMTTPTPIEYHVSLTFGDSFQLFSNSFDSKKSAKKMYKFLSKMFKNQEVDVVLYKSESTHIQYGTYEDEFEQDTYEEDLTGMTLEEFEDAYLLVPEDGDHRAGKKHFLGGLWMKSQEAWLFEGDQEKTIEYLLDLGAKFYEDEDYVIVETEEDEDLSGMSLAEYGKGYLLTPTENDERIGTKYFLGGWWMPKHNAWFFKEKFVDYLEELGASFDCEEEMTESEDEFDTISDDLSTMLLTPYGKGYLLKPHRKDERYGIKYFLDGWWMESLNGWFFKREFFDDLVELGAHFVNKTNKNKNKKSSKKSASLPPKEDNFPFNSSVWDDIYNGDYTEADKIYKDTCAGSANQCVKKNSKSSAKSSWDPCGEEAFRGIRSKSLSWEKYGKGYLLVPRKSYKHNGTKYFRGGWWMPKHNAWFFKESARNEYIKKNESKSKNKSR